MTEPWYKPKLIEVSLPIEDINRESVREKSVGHGHRSTIHLWWARRPLAACRAVLFAQLVDDPSAHPDKFPSETEQESERKRLHGIISRMVNWENIHDEKLLKEAREEILKSTGGNPPSILDPFAGGGSIPLEAQRLGLEANASDLNPVAVLINKALIEIPPKWKNRKPVFPGAASERMSWHGATGLAEDVRCYGKWMRDEAEKRIGHLYPKVSMGGMDATAAMWLWSRTVACPNPACGGTMPLIRSFWLSKKKHIYLNPISDGKKVRFNIEGPEGTPRSGTVGRAGAVCLLCDTPVPLSYIREQGKNGRLGTQLIAIIAEGQRRRYYVAPTEEHEKAAAVLRPDDAPEAELPEQALGFRVQAYGMRSWADLFTNRQLTVFCTFSDLVQEARDRAAADSGNSDYADAVATYLALAVSRAADTSSTLAAWKSYEDKVSHGFTRQAISMVWDFAEVNCLAGGAGDIELNAQSIAKVLDHLPDALIPGTARQQDARLASSTNNLISTDPPYYDNVGYADLSDFFYIWLRRSLRNTYPDLLGTVVTPKADELIANPFRHDDANEFFEQGFSEVFKRACERTPADYPIAVFYAFKQAEKDDDGGHASTGWETLLQGMITSGWAVTGTWPIRTELSNRPRGFDSNALASSVVLACRPRPANAAFTDRRGLIQALRDEFPKALRKLEQGKVAPVDLRQAAIGPGMAVFSRYARVNEPDGSQMRVRAALSLINQVLEEKLAQIGGDVSADTRFCVEWFKQFGFDSGPFGTADVLARGVDTAVSGLERSEVLTSRAGKVKLLSAPELPVYYEPGNDDRTSEWKICLHLAKALQNQGTDAAARLMAASRDVSGIDLDDVKELAYLLYTIAEKKSWAETALLFNNLGTSWTDIEDTSRKATTGGGLGQAEFTLEFGSDDDGDE